MRSEIKALHQRLSTTTVYVTHDQVEAMTMADRIVVMQDGRVEQVGAPLELYDRPANLFVATFIGSPAMNLIEGRITGEGFVTTSGLTLPLASAPAGSQGQPALYGIRPEHFSLGGEGSRGESGRGEGGRGEGGIPAEVVVVEPTGSETQVVAKLAGQNLTAVFRERVHTRPGETLTLSPDPTKVHLFEKDSGQRL
jgi:multiple sugar transport system ATP-binding protein